VALGLLARLLWNKFHLDDFPFFGCGGSSFAGSSRLVVATSIGFGFCMTTVLEVLLESDVVVAAASGLA
jgi:hypothetical protein